MGFDFSSANANIKAKAKQKEQEAQAAKEQQQKQVQATKEKKQQLAKATAEKYSYKNLSKPVTQKIADTVKSSTSNVSNNITSKNSTLKKTVETISNPQKKTTQKNYNNIEIKPVNVSEFIDNTTGVKNFTQKVTNLANVESRLKQIDTEYNKANTLAMTNFSESSKQKSALEKERKELQEKQKKLQNELNNKPKQSVLTSREKVYENQNALGKAKMIAQDVGKKANEIGVGLGYGFERGVGSTAIGRKLGMTQDDQNLYDNAFWSAKLGRTPTAELPKATKNAMNVGGAAGNMTRFIVLNAMGGPVLAGATGSAIDSYGAYKTDEQIKRATLSGGIFGAALSSLSNVFGQVGQTVLNSTPFKNSIVANVGTRAITNFASAVGADQLSNLPLEESEKKTIQDSLLNAGVYTAFGIIGDSLKAVDASKNVKLQLADATENFEKEFVNRYADATRTLDPVERNAKFNEIISGLDDLETAIKQNKYIGASKEIGSMQKGIQQLKQYVTNEANINIQSQNRLGSGIGNTSVLPSVLPNASNVVTPTTTNIPQNLAISNFVKPSQTNTELSTQISKVSTPNIVSQTKSTTTLAKPTQTQEQLVSRIQNNKTLSTAEKNDLVEIINSKEYTKDVETAVNDILKNVDEVSLEKVKNNKGNDVTKLKQNSVDNVENYDNKYIDLAKDSIKAGRGGRYTKDQWLQVAKNLGEQIYDMSDSEIEKYAYKSWTDNMPSRNFNKQGKGFTPFTSDEWVNTVYDSAKSARNRTTDISNNTPKTQTEIAPIQETKATNNVPITDTKAMNTFIDNATEKDLPQLQNILNELTDKASDTSLRINLDYFGQAVEKITNKINKLQGRSYTEDTSETRLKDLKQEVMQYVQDGIVEKQDITDLLKAQKELDTYKKAQALYEQQQKNLDRQAREKYKQFWREQIIKAEEKLQAEKNKLRKQNVVVGNKLLKNLKVLKNTKSVPQELRPIVKNLLDSIDLKTKSLTEEKAASLKELKTWYEEQKANNKDFIPNEHIEKEINRLSQMHINNMDLESKQQTLNDINSLLHEIKTSNQLLAQEKAESVRDTANKMAKEIKSSAGKKVRIKGLRYVAKQIDKLLTAPNMALKISGWDRNSATYKVIKTVTDGAEARNMFQMKADKIFENVVNEYGKELETFSGKKSEGIKLPTSITNGEDVTITKAMRTYLALAKGDPDALMYLENGGMVVPKWKEYKAGNISDAYSHGTVIKLTPSQIDEIIKDMTPMEKAYLKATQKYFDTLSKEEINKIYEELYGYSKISRESGYCPISVDRGYVEKTNNTIATKNDAMRRNFKWLEDRKSNYSKPIDLVDINTITENRIKDTALFVGFEKPIRDLDTLLNTETESGKTLQAELEAQWGKEMVEYFTNYAHDVQGFNRDMNDFDRGVAKVRKNYVGAAIIQNAIVFAQQLGSIPAMIGELGVGSSVKGTMKAFADMAGGRSSKELTNLINTYTGEYYYRQKGNNVETANEITTQGKKNKIIDTVTGKNWVATGDLTATGRFMWNMAEQYVADNNPNLKKGSDEFNKKVAEIYNETMHTTQPMFDPAYRSGALREQGALPKSWYAFRTVPNQFYNMMYSGVAESFAMNKKAAQAKKEYKNNPNAETKQAYEEAKKQASEANKRATNKIVGVLTANAVVSLMRTGWEFLKGDDDKYKDENGNIDGEKVLKEFANKNVDMFFALARLPELIYNLVTKRNPYTDIQILGISTINDLQKYSSDLWDSVLKAKETGEWKHTTKPANEFAKVAAQFLGIPLATTQRQINMIVRNFNPEFYEQYSGFYNYNQTQNKKYFEDIESSGISLKKYNEIHDLTKNVEGEYTSEAKKMIIDEYGKDLTEEQRQLLYKELGVGKVVRKKGIDAKTAEKVKKEVLPKYVSEEGTPISQPKTQKVIADIDKTLVKNIEDTIDEIEEEKNVSMIKCMIIDNMAKGLTETEIKALYKKYGVTESTAEKVHNNAYGVENIKKNVLPKYTKQK